MVVLMIVFYKENYSLDILKVAQIFSWIFKKLPSRDSNSSAAGFNSTGFILFNRKEDNTTHSSCFRPFLSQITFLIFGGMARGPKIVICFLNDQFWKPIFFAYFIWIFVAFLMGPKVHETGTAPRSSYCIKISFLETGGTLGCSPKILRRRRTNFFSLTKTQIRCQYNGTHKLFPFLDLPLANGA